MKKKLLLILCLLLIPHAVFASGKPVQPLPVKAAILVNMTTGHVLFEQNADRLIQPASLSKIMSLYLICEDVELKRVALSDQVTVSVHAVRTGGSKMLFEAGARYGLYDLMKGMAVHSANDATIALAEHVAGTEKKFVARMNAKARALGLKDTHFVNPHGLPNKKQKTTARDIYVLSREYLRRFPDASKIHALERLTFNDMTFINRNDLLQSYPGVDGLKTGYVHASGYHLIATAVRGQTRLIAVVMGAKSKRIRSQQTKLLLDYGFARIGAERALCRTAGE